MNRLLFSVLKRVSSLAVLLSFGLIGISACSGEMAPQACLAPCYEAEAAVLRGAFVISESDLASGNAYVRTPERLETDISDHMEVPDPNDRLEFRLTEKPGTYAIKVWVAGKDLASDSFYVRVNDEPYFVYSFNNTGAIETYPEFIADFVRHGNDDPKLFVLDEQATLTFYLREAGAALDKLELIPR